MIFTIGIYLAVFVSALYQGISLFRKKPFPVKVAGLINLGISALLLILLIIRSLQIRFIALTSTYESLLFYALGILMLTGWYGCQKKIKTYGIVLFFATLAALGLLLVASSSPCFSRIEAACSGTSVRLAYSSCSPIIFGGILFRFFFYNSSFIPCKQR